MEVAAGIAVALAGTAEEDAGRIAALEAAEGLADCSCSASAAVLAAVEAPVSSTSFLVVLSSPRLATLARPGCARTVTVVSESCAAVRALEVAAGLVVFRFGIPADGALVMAALMIRNIHFAAAVDFHIAHSRASHVAREVKVAPPFRHPSTAPSDTPSTPLRPALVAAAVANPLPPLDYPLSVSGAAAELLPVAVVVVAADQAVRQSTAETAPAVPD